MFEGFQYISEHGILRRHDYRDYHKSKGSCDLGPEGTGRRAAIRDIGYVEHDGRVNDELKELLNRQPISIGMRTTGMLQMYSGGIMTESFLHCSSTNNEVNHGVLLIGYGTSDPHDKDTRGCRDYWIIRNSWGGNWGEHGMFKLCADGLGSQETPMGTCLVNKYSVWPTMDKSDIEE